MDCLSGNARPGGECVDPAPGFCDPSQVNALDPNIARQLAADLPHDVFISIVRTFETDLGALVQRMVDALQQSDLPAYRRAAHALAGAAGAIGAMRLEGLARRAMAPDAAPAPDAVETLGIEARAALMELEQLAGTPRPG